MIRISGEAAGDLTHGAISSLFKRILEDCFVASREGRNAPLYFLSLFIDNPGSTHQEEL
jgi:hypothetical protein